MLHKDMTKNYINLVNFHYSENIKNTINCILYIFGK